MKLEMMLIGTAALLAIAGCSIGYARLDGQDGQKETTRVNALKGIATQDPQRPDKVVLTDAEWKKKLTDEQYRVLRNHGTEAAFCGVFFDNHKTGVYYCAGCGLPLFASTAKFDSGTGWPSFFQPVSKDAVWIKTDRSYGMVRDEVLCARCDGHLGHVFEDAPQTPTGLRFCMNSASFTFKEGDPAKLIGGH